MRAALVSSTLTKAGTASVQVLAIGFALSSASTCHWGAPDAMATDPFSTVRPVCVCAGGSALRTKRDDAQTVAALTSTASTTPSRVVGRNRNTGSLGGGRPAP